MAIYNLNLFLCVLLLSFSSTVLSELVYEQPWGGSVTGPFSQTQGNIPSNAQEIADNFTAQGDWVVNGISWFGSYSTTPLSANDQADFLIRFYNDADGVPSTTPFYEQSVIPSYRATTSTSTLFGYQFSVVLTTPVAFNNADNYWIAILDDDDLTSNYIWNGNALGVGDRYAFRQNADWGLSTDNVFGNTDRAFALITVPIPSAFLLFATGLGSIFRLSNRNRQTANQSFKFAPCSRRTLVHRAA